MRLLEISGMIISLLGTASAFCSTDITHILTNSSTSSSCSAVVCNSTFKSVTASAWINGANPGWNLGNTLDAIPSEGDWNNPPVQSSTFDEVRKAGFKSVRIPVTYAYHFTSGSPSWDIDQAWLQRVSDVVDQVIARDLLVLTNVHHDSWLWADVTATNANYTEIEEKFYRLWYQIGTKLACKSSLLAFEPINEPPATTADQAAELMKLENIFLQALKDSGGFNSHRVVTLNGPSEDSIKTSEFFVRPTNITNPWAIQYHYYSPYDFISSAWGRTIWGSDTDKQSLEVDISNIRNNFTDIPLLIGEWSASPVATETAARWKYFDFLVRTARKYNTSTMLWDNGADFLDRSTGIWSDQTAIDIYMAANNNTINSLPDSTVEQSATSQSTSADIFHRYGTEVTDQTLAYIFSGNTLTSISVGNVTLSKGQDYTVSNDSITYKSAFLSSHISRTTDPGSIANLTLTFSSGAPLTANLVQWDVPIINSTFGSAAALNGSDLTIPIQWRGIGKLATVRGLLDDGTILLDSYTQYFGPLQTGRMTYSSNWNWNTSHVIITAATVADVVAAGRNAVFTFEFYPRVAGNSVNYTLTV